MTNLEKANQLVIKLPDIKLFKEIETFEIAAKAKKCSEEIKEIENDLSAELKAEITPKKMVIKEIEAKYNPTLLTLSAIRTKINAAIFQFQKKQEEITREKERLIEESRQALLKQDDKQDDAMALAQSIVDTPNPVIAKEDKLLGTRKDLKVEIVDIDSVPLQYVFREINFQEVKKFYRQTGRQINGLKIYYDEILSGR